MNAISLVILIGVAISQIGMAANLGRDQKGRACSFSISEYKVGPQVAMDPCEFELDGPGPWCEGKPKVIVSQVTGTGVFASAAGKMAFVIDDQYAELSSKVKSFVARASNGAAVDVKIKGNILTAYLAFLTPYGKSLSGDAISNLLMNVPEGVWCEAV